MVEAFESELNRESVSEASEARVDGDAAQMPIEATVAPRRKRPPIWPFNTYVLLVSAVIAGIAASIQHASAATTMQILITALSAGILGLAALLGMVAGLWGRCWLAGFWMAWLLATVGVVATIAAMEYEYLSAEDVLEQLVIAFIVPAVMFALAAPHLLMRSLCGWRLDRADRPFQRKRSGGLLDLMALVTVLASVSSLLRVPLVVWEIRPADYLAGIGIAAAMLFTVSMLLVVPSVKFAFRGHTRLRRWLLPSGIFMLGMGSIVATTERIENASWSDIEWMPIMIVVPGATAVFLIGLATLKVAGFGLVRNVRPGDRHAVTIVDDPLLQPARLRALHIRWAAGTLLVAVVTSVVLNVQVGRRTRQDAELAQLAERLRSRGGELSVHNRIPQRAKIGDATDVADLLAELSRHGTLTELALAGSNVDDELLSQLPQWFPGLERLDLRHTRVTAEGLRHLLPLSHLNWLGLAGTDLTIDQINRFLQEPAKDGLLKLDLSETQLNAEAIGQLDKRIDHLAIRRLGFSDSDLTSVHDRSFASLDISGNPIAGHGLAKMKVFELVAHDVPLDDDGLRAFLGNPNTSVNTLVISNTQLTDASAPLLVGVQQLHLGDGTISEAALAASVTNLDTLGLHGKQLTGESLHTFVPQINVQYLDLSGSGVTDQALIDLGVSLQQSNTYLIGLGLADTEITDRGIQGLDDSPISELDLRRTGLSAAGISRMESHNTIYVDVNQFTPQQLEMLRDHHTIRVSSEPWWSSYDGYKPR